MGTHTNRHEGTPPIGIGVRSANRWVARLGEASGEMPAPLPGWGAAGGAGGPCTCVLQALAPAVGPAGAAQAMKGLRGTRTPRARSQSWDMALWASPDMEPRSGVGELWLEQGPLSTQGSPTHRASRPFRPSPQGRLSHLGQHSSSCPGDLGEVALDPQNPPAFLTCPPSSLHPRLVGLRRGARLQDGAHEPMTLPDQRLLPEHKLELAVLVLLGIEAPCPHSVPTCETRGPQALAAPQGVLTLKGCASTVATEASAPNTGAGWVREF